MTGQGKAQHRPGSLHPWSELQEMWKSRNNQSGDYTYWYCLYRHIYIFHRIYKFQIYIYFTWCLKHVSPWGASLHPHGPPVLDSPCFISWCHGTWQTGLVLYCLPWVLRLVSTDTCSHPTSYKKLVIINPAWAPARANLCRAAASSLSLIELPRPSQFVQVLKQVVGDHLIQEQTGYMEHILSRKPHQ